MTKHDCERRTALERVLRGYGEWPCRGSQPDDWGNGWRAAIDLISSKPELFELAAGAGR